jgi:hypothetical protein
MDIKDIRRNPDPRKSVRAELREVVTDFAGQPQLFVRLKLAGWNFPERAPEPFMLVGRTISERVVIAPDGLSAAGYFAEPLPEAEGVSFGYGNTVSWDFPVHIRPERLRRLDRRRLADTAIPDRLR